MTSDVQFEQQKYNPMNVVEVNDGPKKKKDATDVIDDTQTQHNAEYPEMQFEAQMVGDESQNGAAKKKKKKKKKPTQRADGEDEEPTGDNEALLKAKQDEEVQMKKQLDKQRRELEEQQKQLDDMKRKEREQEE